MCPATWGVNDGQCVKMFATKEIWTDAIDKCSKSEPGAKLVTIRSTERNEWLSVKMTSNNLLAVWFDATADGKGKWFDTKGYLYGGGAFTDFNDCVKNKDCPNGNNSPCLTKTHETTLSWKRLECTATRAYACELGNVNTLFFIPN